jgi:hypothetical protein
MNRWVIVIGLFIVALIAAAMLILIPAPNTAVAPTGNNFATTTQNQGNAADKADKIVASAPKVGDAITSPLTISGKARGNWYFEAVFPIQIKDASGKVVAQGQGHAQGEWTTTDFVPFTATIDFPPQAKGSSGTVVLKKDNPSGDPSRDEELDIPVTFK